nr:tyrosine-type recombinase/integrase [Pseudoalteromonas piscicida]
MVKLEQEARRKKGDKNLHALILLGAYTGARREELGRLRTENVKTKDGIFYLEITDSKTVAGVRDVPIHPNIQPLIENLIETSSDGFLLPNEPVRANGERTDALGKRFGNLKAKLGFGAKHVFHSFRNTVITQLGNAGIQQYLINDIIGHEQTTMAFGVYAGDLSLAKRLEAVKTINYVGLDASPKYK